MFETVHDTLLGTVVLADLRHPGNVIPPKLKRHTVSFPYVARRNEPELGHHLRAPQELSPPPGSATTMDPSDHPADQASKRGSGATVRARPPTNLIESVPVSSSAVAASITRPWRIAPSRRSAPKFSGSTVVDAAADSASSKGHSMRMAAPPDSTRVTPCCVSIASIRRARMLISIATTPQIGRRRDGIARHAAQTHPP